MDQQDLPVSGSRADERTSSIREKNDLSPKTKSQIAEQNGAKLPNEMVPKWRNMLQML